MSVYAIWPARPDWQPGGNWRQVKRWLVLDVSRGLKNAVVVHRCEDRNEACTRELEQRRANTPPAAP